MAEEFKTRREVPEYVFDDIDLDKPFAATNPASTILYLIDQLSASSVPLTIFVDDFGVIDNPEVEDGVQQLINRMPADKRLIMSMREAPNLELGKLRAKGQVIEVDAHGLRFDQEEVVTFLRQTHDLDVPEVEENWLYRSTEGWIAGMQLYALSYKLNRGASHSIKTIPGGFKQISDYLSEDVLTLQPESIQAFLLQTSILDRLTGSLCSALTGHSDGAEMLEYLVKQNLFVVPLDEEGRWYRYHSLFRKFLKNRLERGLRDRVIHLHQKAAHWFAEQGELQEAAGHAFAAGDIESAAAILEDCAARLVTNGYSATLLTLADQLPIEKLLSSQQLLVPYCWALVLKDNFAKADKVIGLAMESIHHADALELQCDLTTIQALAALAQDHIDETERLVNRVQSQSSEIDFVSKPALLAMIAHIKLCAGEHGAAMVFIGQADRLSREKEDFNVSAYARYLVALHELMHGRLYAAISHSREALAELATGLSKYTPQVMTIVVILAEALYERNELKEARTLLESYRSSLSTNVVFPDALLIGFRTLARIDFANGHTQGAKGALSELERIAAYAGLPRLGASVRMEKIRMALEERDVDKAQRIFREWDDSKVWAAFEGHTLPGNESDTFELSKNRLMISRGKGKEALELLRPELKRAEAAGLLRKGLKVRLLMVKAYDATNQGRAALRSLREAVLISQNENFVRSYVDEGQPITDFETDKARALLAYLAAGTTVPPVNPSRGSGW